MVKEAQTDFPIHTLLRQRRSALAFAPRPVEPVKLRSLFEAARWAPSSYNEQPWAFLVATQDESAEFTRMLGVLAEGNIAWARHAPLLAPAEAHPADSPAGAPSVSSEGAFFNATTYHDPEANRPHCG